MTLNKISRCSNCTLLDPPPPPINFVHNQKFKKKLHQFHYVMIRNMTTFSTIFNKSGIYLGLGQVKTLSGPIAATRKGLALWLHGQLYPCLTYKIIIYIQGFPPPINFVHGSHMYGMNIIEHEAAESGPLACPSRGARSPSLTQPQSSAPLSCSGIFLENDFWTPPQAPPPINVVHGSYRKCLNLT